MSISIFKNGDLITSLPTDDNEPSLKEMTILDMLYPKPEHQLKNIDTDTKKVFFHFKDIVIASALFLILNLPIIDEYIEKYSRTSNLYYKLVIKVICFSLLLFIINNFSLSKKSQ